MAPTGIPIGELSVTSRLSEGLLLRARAASAEAAAGRQLNMSAGILLEVGETTWSDQEGKPTAEPPNPAEFSSKGGSQSWAQGQEL
eukprot:2620692-Amphidinium_carterae.2